LKDQAGIDQPLECLLEPFFGEFADRRRNPVGSQPESVKSGKRIGELTQGKGT